MECWEHDKSQECNVGFARKRHSLICRRTRLSNLPYPTYLPFNCLVGLGRCMLFWPAIFTHSCTYARKHACLHASTQCSKFALVAADTHAVYITCTHSHGAKNNRPLQPSVMPSHDCMLVPQWLMLRTLPGPGGALVRDNFFRLTGGSGVAGDLTCCSVM